MSVFDDNFNRANGPPGANYTYVGGGSGPQVAGNLLSTAGHAFAGSLLLTGGPGSIAGDHVAQVTVGGDDGNWILGIGFSADGQNGYYVFDGTIRRWTGGADAATIDTFGTIATGSVVQLARKGDDIVLYDDGVEIARATDTTYMSGRIAFNGQSGTFDNFSVLQVTLASVTPNEFQDAATGIGITGTDFGASQGSGRVVISPVDDIDGDVPQTSFVSNTDGGTNPTTSTTITVPTVADGDLMIVAFTSRDHTSGTAQPTVSDNDGSGSWTQKDFSTDRKAQLWYRRATSTMTGRTITISGAVGSLAAVLRVFRDAYPTGDPITNLAQESNISGNETHAAITPNNAGSAVVGVVFNYANDNAVTNMSTATFGALQNFNEHLSTGGSDCAVAIASRQNSPASTTGAFTWAQTNGTTYSMLFAIRPRDSIGAAVEQTVTSWADTAISYTAARETLPLDTDLYLFVENGDGISNIAGHVVRFVADAAVELEGDATAGATGSATLALGISLAGAAVAAATAAASMLHAVPLAGSAIAGANADAQLDVARTMQGAAVAGAIGNGALDLHVRLGGDALAGAVGAAQAEHAVFLAGGAGASLQAIANLSIAVNLSGDAIAQLGASAALAKKAPLAGAATVAAAGAGALLVGVKLTGSAVAGAQGEGEIEHGVPLSGDAVAGAEGAAELSGGVALTGDAIAGASAGAMLRLQVPLTAQAVAHALASAQLAVHVTLQADAIAQAIAGAALTVIAHIELAGAAVGGAAAAGALTVGPGVPPLVSTSPPTFRARRAGFDVRARSSSFTFRAPQASFRLH